tara:strand:- start:268 stop:774 length:507 start_codon:yes stop_codon:yes gene_type:complete
MVKTKKRVKTQKIPKKYLPRSLSRKDKLKQKKMLRRSQRMYKSNKYYTRDKVKSYRSKKSGHIIKAEKVYNINKVVPNKELSEKTGCSIQGLRQIVKKGQGAYYSSGSRPNQTAHSWGRARLASAITGGKSSQIDYHILKKSCKKGSKALRLADRSKYKKGIRRVAKT